MSDFKQSLLDLVTRCELQHCGGEALIYVVSIKENTCVLKWYKEKSLIDQAVLKKISSIKKAGVYRVRECGIRENHPYVVYDFIDGISSADLEIPVIPALIIIRKIKLCWTRICA